MADRKYTTVAQDAQRPTETSEPVRAPSRESDVYTPLFQAGVSAVLITLVVALALSRLPIGDELYAELCAGVFGVTALLVWFWRMGVITEAWYRVETLTGVDANKDGAIGAPHYMRTNKLPVRQAVMDHDHAELIRFVELCYDKGKDGRAAPWHVLRAEKFTDGQVRRYVREMVTHGIGRLEGGQRKVLHLLLAREDGVRMAKELTPLMGGRK